MKLAFCLFKYFPYGGMQRDFKRIALACQEAGYGIRVFAMSWEGDIPPGFEVTLVPARGLSNHGRCIDFAKKVHEYLREEEFGAVVGFNKMPGLDVYFAADPCFEARALEDRGPLYRFGRRYRVYRDLEEAVFASENHTEILLLSEPEKAKFIACYGTAEKRFHLLPPGIARDRVAPDNAEVIRRQLREEFGLADDEPMLLMVGSGYKTKGLDRSIRALAGLPENLKAKARLFVLGRGKARPFLKMAQRLGVAEKVCLLGARDDVPRFLLGADLLLQPSYTEAAGMVLLEAMASGLPVLVTDVCGYAFHIERAGAGLLAPSPFRQAEFDGLLERMLTSEEREGWKEGGLDYAARTDIYSLPERAAEVIASVARKRRVA